MNSYSHPTLITKMTYLSLLVSSLIANSAYADCTLGGDTWSCSGANQTQTVGSGQNDNGKTVNVGSGAAISVGDMNAISLGDNATITNDGTIANNAVRASGDYGTGANTIEVKNNATITNNGTIRNSGTENNGETINVHGFGNTIINNGTIETAHAAALWFQDWSNQIGLGGTNRVVNNGTITRADGGNVIGTSAANSSAPGIDFTNNGLVNGNLIFAGGNDKLTFLPGSNVTGNINGGGGTNSLILDGGNTSVGGELAGAIKNFTTLTKIGTGIWTVSGPLQGFNQVTVQEGNLSLTGNNDGFTGNLLVMSGAGLEARAQSLPTNSPTTGNTGNVHIESNANLVINQDDNGAYIGQIVGDGRVIKSGAGIVTLAPQSGANLYTGSTAITGGGISISSATALGSGALAINQGSLITTADMTLNKAIYLASAVPNATAIIDTEGGSTLTLTQGLQGVNASGTFLKTGNGVLALEGDNTYLGAVNIDAGTLRVSSNSANNLTGQLSIVQNARLEGTGTVGSTSLATINGGTIAPGSASDMYGTLTIRGDYSGQPGGSVDIHTQLSDDNSPAGKLVIEGSTGYIPTSVRIIDNWGSGAYTTNGIPIIEVHGNSDPNAFRLDYHYKRPDGTETIIAGNYLYQLKHIASGAAGTWVLANVRTPTGTLVLNPSIPVYESYIRVLANFNRVPTLQQRVGNRSWASLSSSYDPQRNDRNDGDKRYMEESGLWTRVEGGFGKLEPEKSTTNAKLDLDFWRMQIGIDKPISKSSEGDALIGGLSFHYGRAIGEVKSYHGKGKIFTDGYGFATTLTWYGQSGFYSDMQAQMTWLDSDLKSYDLVNETLKNGNKGFGYAFSYEAGRVLRANELWSFTPQAQLIYSKVDFDKFTDNYRVRVTMEDGDSLLARLGFAADYEKSYIAKDGKTSRVKAYGIANAYYEFLDGNEVDISDIRYSSRDTRLWVGPAVGGSYNWNNDNYSAYGEIGAKTSAKHFGDNYAVSGEVGLRMRF